MESVLWLTACAVEGSVEFEDHLRGNLSIRNEDMIIRF